MKLYELTYLISPELSPEELNFFQEKLITFLQEEKGVLIEKSKLIRKNLAYPIKKKSWAILGFLNFNLNKENLESFEKKLKAEKQILRFLILNKKLSRKPLKVPRKPLISKKILKPRKKVDISEIEKKLEEILEE